MFKKKVKIELSDEEQRIILYALNELRTELIQENKYTDVANEAIWKLKNKMKADRYNLGVILNALDRKRKMNLLKEMIQNRWTTWFWGYLKYTKH